MISYIRGTLERRAESYIIIETGGIGYRIYQNISPAVPAGKRKDTEPRSPHAAGGPAACDQAGG